VRKFRVAFAARVKRGEEIMEREPQRRRLPFVEAFIAKKFVDMDLVEKQVQA